MQEEHLSTFVDAMKNVSVIITDASLPEPNILEFSLGAESIFGYQRKEVVSRSINILFDPEEQRHLPEIMDEIKKNHEGFSMETNLVRKTGEVIPTLFSIYPVFTKEGVMWGILWVSIDISQQKSIQISLAKSEEKYRLLSENASDIVWTADLNLKYTYISPSVERILGYVPEELLSLPVTTTLTPSSSSQAIHFFQEGMLIDSSIAKDGQKTRTLELQHSCKDGSTIWVEMKLSCIHNDKGDPVGIQGITRDITEQKEMADTLRKNEERFRMIMAKTPAVIYSYQLIQGVPRITYINENLKHVLGLDPQPFIDNQVLWKESLHPDDLQEIEEKKELLIKEGRGVLEYRFKDHAGKYHWILDNQQLVFQDDDILEVVGVWWDITSRKKAEEALQRAEETYRNLFLNAKIGLFRSEIHSGFLLDANDALARFAGFNSREEMLARPFPIENRYVHLDDRIQMLSLLKQEGEVRNFEARFRRNDGSIIWLSFSGKIVPEKGWMEGVAEDITQRKEGEERLNDYVQRVEQLYHQLDQEMDKARQIHDRMLKTSLPTIDDIIFVGKYLPAAKIGGDFYDVIKRDRKMVFYLSDVSGHGLDGSILSLFVKHTIKGFLSFSPTESITPANILDYLNSQYLQENYPDAYFISIFLGVLDLETMELTYSGLGFQDIPFVRMGNGEEIRLLNKGFFITSIFTIEKKDIKEQTIFLTPGTTLFFNTDGLSEQGEAPTYYRERLPGIFYENAHLPPQYISQAVLEDFQEFNHGSLQARDDITFLVLQVKPENSKSYLLTMATDLQELKKIRSQIFELLHGCDNKNIILTCVNELLMNAMEHGNGMDPKKRVSLQLELLPDYVQIDVEDEGKGFNWSHKIHRQLELEGFTERGRGIAMTRILCDCLFYNEKGNRATMIMVNQKIYEVE